MPNAPTQFPHHDISEEGPPLTAALCAFSRDDERYWEKALPRDHTHDGVLVAGPEAEDCALESQIGFTYCAISASTPENERKRYVTQKARAHQVQSGFGLYGRSRKPANSGRKRRAA